VIDWRGSARTADLRPAVVVQAEGGNVAKLARGGDARWLLPVEAIIAVEPGSKVKAGDVLARVSTESAKTRDITGGLPRVAELFEARRRRTRRSSRRNPGRSSSGATTRTSVA
jgi:DNA-directed RNA polymerase subunit beta'